MSRPFDVIVIGVGAMGSAACAELARRGARVLGLEQFDIPNDLGSSHGGSRMIRMAYFEHPDYVPLLSRAYEAWREVEQLAGMNLLHETGGLYLGPKDCKLVAGSIAAARQHGLAHEQISADEVKKRYSVFTLPEDYVGLFEPRAGFLQPELCVAALAELARRRGAELREQMRVRNWSSDARGVTVDCQGETFHADQLLITAGPWSAQLVKNADIQLQVTRQTMAWFSPQAQERFDKGFPVWAVHRPASGIYYGFPLSRQPPGIKVAIHAPGAPTSPDEVDRSTKPQDLDELLHFLSNHLPLGLGPLVKQSVCLYTNSVDHHFVVNRHSHYEHVTLACGFSGHGFKFATVMGEVLADLVLEGSTKLPAQFLGASRFRNRSATD